MKLRNNLETWSAAGMVLAVVLLVAMAATHRGPSAPVDARTPGLPAPAPLPRGPAQLPARVRVVPEARGFVPREDVLAGTLDVPSGRLAVDDFWYGEPQVVVRVPPGRHAIRATLSDEVGALKPAGSAGAVALVTVITGTGTPIHWRDAGTMGTDGGTGGIASVEAGDRLRSEPSQELHDRLLAQLNAATRDQITELRLGGGLSVFSFPAGLGDGGYGVFTGTDATGTVTRVVFDGGLLHLAWPTEARASPAT